MQTVTATQKWLMDWFREQSPDAAAMPDLEMLSSDYFERGFIDSFGVISLIEDVEAKFGIKFSEEAFQDRRFSVIASLGDLIDEQKR